MWVILCLARSSGFVAATRLEKLSFMASTQAHHMGRTSAHSPRYRVPGRIQLTLDIS